MNANMPKLFVRLLAVAVVHSLILGWMVWERVTLLQDGREVTLLVQPVDPRDFLRGDYIILRYEISEISVPDVSGDTKFERLDKVYVGLQSSDAGPWKAVSLHHDLPEGTSATVFIKGTIRSVTNMNRPVTGGSTRQLPGCPGSNCVRISIKYGMEKYFIPEGDGLKLEALRNDKVLSIVAAVSATGQAGIKSLLVRGKPVYNEPVF